MQHIEADTETDRTQKSLRELLGLPDHREPIRFAQSRLAVTLSAEMANTLQGQWAAAMAVNLLFRLKEIKAITVSTPNNVPVLPPVPLAPGELSASLKALAESLSGPQSPYQPEYGHILDQSGTYDAILSIGDPPKGIHASRYIVVWADDWTGYVNCASALVSRRPACLPFGAYSAACLGVADIFKHLLVANYPAAMTHKIRFLENKCLSLLDFSVDPMAAGSRAVDLPGSLNMGHVAVFGCGAGGTACLYTLASVPHLDGRLSLVEPNKLKRSNLNRYPMATYADVYAGRHKVDTAQEFLERVAPQFDVTAYPVSYQVFMARGYGQSLSADTVIVCTVDNVATRRAIQSDLRKCTILDCAVTGTIYAVLKVYYGSGRCLGCKHPLRSDEFEQDVASKWGLPLREVKELRARGGILEERHIQSLARAQRRPVSHFSQLLGREFNEAISTTQCGEVALGYSLDVPGQVATLPFLTTLPGVIVAAEIVKHRHLPEYALRNWFEHDLLHEPKQRLHRWKPPIRQCSVGCSKTAR
jgi:molybdopterin/thiamine biosynthesis adenylyltransferase